MDKYGDAYGKIGDNPNYRSLRLPRPDGYLTLWVEGQGLNQDKPNSI